MYNYTYSSFFFFFGIWNSPRIKQLGFYHFQIRFRYLEEYQ